MKKIVSASALLMTALTLAACADPGGSPSPGPRPGSSPAPGPGGSQPAGSVIGSGDITVQGYLTSQNGGAAVPGSSVTLHGSSGAALGQGLTDSRGRFQLRVAPGSYTLDFSKAGYAASRVENFPVTAGGQAGTQAGTQPPLNVIQRVAFDSSFKAIAPTIEVRALVGGGEMSFPNDPARALSFKASEGLTLRYRATAGDPSLSPQLVYADIGLENTPGSAFFGARSISSNDPKNTTFDQTVSVKDAALRGVRGASYLNLVVYDTNYNRTNSYLPVRLSDDQPLTAAPGSFLHPTARAVTLSQKIGFFSPPRPDAQVRPSAAPTEGSTLWVDLKLDYQGDKAALLGYRIFTSDDGATYRLLKTLPATATVARDSSPSLEPGRKVYYTIQAYSSSAAVQSPVLSTTPLDAFHVTRLSPANRSRGVSLSPQLGWSVDRQVGDARSFWVYVSDYPSQGGSDYWGQLFNPDPQANNVYTDDGRTPALKVSGLDYAVGFNENGKAVAPQLESDHSYTLDLSAAAFSRDGAAVSVAQDYYDVFGVGLPGCNFGGPVCEGSLSTFTTGSTP